MKKKDNFIDVIPTNLDILVYSFDVDRLQKNNEDYHLFPITSSIHKTLIYLNNSRKESIQNKDFTIYLGDSMSGFGDYFYVGITRKINSHIQNQFLRNFKNIHGFIKCSESNLQSMPLYPRYRFFKGKLIQYQSSGAGNVIVDKATGIHWEIRKTVTEKFLKKAEDFYRIYSNKHPKKETTLVR
ncbi:MAG: hypothetical protein H7A23_20335 [Leptospiraceae bacterium]|nr:hypothetical protein [Leptospiraceae bacterium]MCP5496908.1 hypothetical protein [Leptospiraceae bacterium]